MTIRDAVGPTSMIELAERVERESRAGHDPRAPLDELHDTLVECGAPSDSDHDVVVSEAVARMRRIVDQLRRDVESGHVRSISGLSTEARRLSRNLTHAS